MRTKFKKTKCSRRTKFGKGKAELHRFPDPVEEEPSKVPLYRIGDVLAKKKGSCRVAIVDDHIPGIAEQKFLVVHRKTKEPARSRYTAKELWVLGYYVDDQLKPEVLERVQKQLGIIKGFRYSRKQRAEDEKERFLKRELNKKLPKGRKDSGVHKCRRTKGLPGRSRRTR